jgi:predicted ArsR family transcriptional regulator
VVGGPARGRIIGLLRRGERSVEDLAAALGVTDNAVRVHLHALEAAGIVRQARVRRAGTVGKPATMYDIVPDAEPIFSSAYAPVLRALLESLESRLDAAELEDVFRDVGRRIANAHGSTRDAVGAERGLEARVRDAASVLSALGGELDVERTTDSLTIRGFACSLSDAVRVQPKVCRAIEELVSGITGVPVHECCEREGSPRCCFTIARAG